MGARRMAALSLVALVAGGSTAALAASGDEGGAAAAAAATKAADAKRVVNVGIEVRSFSARHRRLVAHGTIRGRVADANGHVQTVRRKVAFAARAGGGCRILYLRLKQLDLKLLGLDVHLGKVRLAITGHRHRGILGKLFCKLAKAVPKLPGGGAARAARSLNRRLARHPLHLARFRAHIAPKARASAATKSCRVLDLVLGPLHLDLLGLVVDLNKVHLSITAHPGEGTLGDLFCRLSDGADTGTTGTTGTTTTSTGTTTTGTTTTG